MAKPTATYDMNSISAFYWSPVIYLLEDVQGIWSFLHVTLKQCIELLV